MERFIASWPSSVNPVDVFKAFEPHFRIPDDDAMDAMQRETRQWREAKQRAQLATQALVNLLKTPSMSRQLNKALTKRVVANFDRIIWWMNELYPNDRQITSAASNAKEIMAFLWSALSFSNNLSEAVRHSPSAVELAARALTIECTVPDLAGKDPGAILGVVSLLLHSGPCRELFLGSIDDRGSTSVNLFVSKLVYFCHFLLVFEKVAREMSVDAGNLVPGLVHVLQIVSEDQRFRSALRKAGYIGHFSRLIAFNRPPYSDAYIVIALKWIREHQPRRCRTALISDFIDEGGLRVVIDTLGESQVKDDQDMFEEIMESVLGFTSSRRVRRAIEEFSHIRFHEEQEADVMVKSTANSGVYSWEDFSASFEARSPEYEIHSEKPDISRPPFCNNLKVSGLPFPQLVCGESMSAELWIALHNHQFSPV
jgi:hypothetical protein